MEYRESRRMWSPISDTDPDYLRDQAQKKKAAEENAAYFGQEFFNKEGEYNGRNLDEVSEKLQQIIKKDGGIGISTVKSFVNDMLMTPELHQFPMIKHVWRNAGGIMSRASQDLYHAMTNRMVPSDVMIAMLKRNSVLQEKVREATKAEIPVLRQRFLKDVRTLQHNPAHPLTADMLPEDRILRRMNQVAVVARDPLEFARSKGVLAQHNSKENTINLVATAVFSGTSPQETRAHMFNHEMIHTVAGQTIAQAPDSYVLVRTGVQMQSSLTWINEAITETLTLDLAQKGREGIKSNAYPKERHIYNALIKKVPEAVFLRAYFENATPLQTAERLPGQMELHGRIIEAYGFNMLAFIDQLDQKGQLHEAVTRFDEQGNWKDK